MSEPRVYWIDNEVLVSASNMLATFVYKTQQQNSIPVVELSAYERLKNNINAGVHVFKCPNCKDYSGPLYNVDLIEQLQSEREKLGIANEFINRLRAALEFYANRFNWISNSGKIGITALTDGRDSELVDGHFVNGKLARSVLAEIGDEK